MRFTLQSVKGKEVSISKSMAKCKINIYTYYTNWGGTTHPHPPDA